MRLTEFLRSKFTRLQALIGHRPLAASGEPAASEQGDLVRFEQAVAHHGQGQLKDAEAVYCELLQKYPKDFDLLHLLGKLRGQRHDYASAVVLIEQALAINPDSPAAHASLGNCLKGLGNCEAALGSYERALALQPLDADTLCNRGGVQVVMKRFEAALDSCDRALAIKPDHVMALDHRGVALRHLKRPVESLASHERALTLNPEYAHAHCNRGMVLADLQQYAAACDSYNRALELDPDNYDTLYNRGTALRNLMRYQEALISFDQALALRGDDPAAHCNRGTVLHDLKRYPEALAAYEQALVVRPGYTDALVNQSATLRELQRHADALDRVDIARGLEPENPNVHFHRGVTLGNLNRFEEALASFDRAIALQPDHVEALNNRGAMLRELRRHHDALASFNRARALRPDHPPLLFNRANLLFDLKRTDEAVADFTRLVALDPDHRFARSQLLHAKMSCCDWDGLDALWTALSESGRLEEGSVHPFCVLSVCDSPALFRQFAEKYAASRMPAPRLDAMRPATRRAGPIRIGYVAGEFRHQATAILMTGLFEQHDKARFELIAFDNGWDDGSEIRKRLEKAFDRMVNISRLGDLEAAEIIRSLEVDILVDLNGYFGQERPGIYSHRPAPIQVNWLGFPGTLGADYMDYIIADAIVIPSGHEIFYPEKVVRLPHCYQVNDSMRAIAPHTPARVEVGLPASGFVYCCFNNNYKITQQVFDIWMRLLKIIDSSVLWLLEDNVAASRNLRAAAAARGVSPDRLVFAPRMALPEHLARHRLADLFLDTLPCNAHTTASDALWAGLPLVTCLGSTFAGRVAGSLLQAVGLPELAADNLQAYETLALRLASSPAWLAELRARLALNRGTHPLFDTNRFRGHLENAFITMHERWLRGETPAHITIAAD